MTSQTLSWELPDNPGLVALVEATVSSSGISYVIMTVGPAGGWGMGGHQSLEVFLERGGLYDMPAEVTIQARALVDELLAKEHAHVTWTIDVPGGAILYVSADIDERSVRIARLDERPGGLNDATPVILFDGSIAPGRHSLVVLAQWQTEGGGQQATFREDVDLTAGTRTAIRTVTS